MIARPRQLLCLLITAVAVAVAGCGGDDEPSGRKLPPQTTQALLQQLESIDDRVATGLAGACDDIFSEDPEVGNIGPIDTELSSIPSDVDPEIRSALEQSIERLTQLVDRECDAIRAQDQDVDEPTTTEQTPTETTPTETETVPTETETVPTTTTPETTPTTPTEEPRTPNGNGPDGTGPPGLDRGGAEAPDAEDGG